MAVASEWAAVVGLDAVGGNGSESTTHVRRRSQSLSRDLGFPVFNPLLSQLLHMLHLRLSLSVLNSHIFHSIVIRALTVMLFKVVKATLSSLDHAPGLKLASFDLC